MKINKQDTRILFAALLAILEGDEDLWENLSDEDQARASDLLDEMSSEIEPSSDEVDPDDEDEYN